MEPVRWRLLIAAAAVGLVGLATWAGIKLLHPTLGPSIATVSSQRLSEAGVVLLYPFPWDTSPVTRAAAEGTALKQAPGAVVLQSALSEVVLTGSSDKQPRLCWVVSLPGSQIRSHGPPGSAHSQATFYLVFIDARTGEFLHGVAGG